MAIVAKSTRTLPVPTATNNGFVFLLSTGWFTQADLGVAGSPIDGGANSIANGGGDLQIFSDEAATIRLPIDIITFVTGGTPSALVRLRKDSYTAGDSITIGKDDTQTSQPLPATAFGRNAVYADREYEYNLYNASSIIDSKGVTSPTVIGSPIDDMTSPFGGGVRFDAGECLDLNQNIGDTTGDLTLRAWVKPNTDAAFATIISIRSGATWSYQWRMESLDPSILIGSASPNSPNGPLLLGSWYNLILTVSGSTITFYRNGTSLGTASVSGARSLNPAINAAIGCSSGGIQEALSSMSLVSMQNGAVSASTVESEYLNQSDPDNFGTSSEWVLVGGAVSIIADSGTYSQTGTSTPLFASRALQSGSASYLQVGTATPLRAELNILTTSGSYLLTGTDVNLRAAKKLITETGSYNLTGTDVILIYTPSGAGEVLIIDSGAYSLAGDEVLLSAQLNIISNSGSYLLSGTETRIAYNANIVHEASSYSLAGDNVNLFANYGMIVSSTSYTLTGTSVTLKYSGDTNQIIGTVTAGFAPDLYSAVYKPNTITVTFKE